MVQLIQMALEMAVSKGWAETMVKLTQTEIVKELESLKVQSERSIQTETAKENSIQKETAKEQPMLTVQLRYLEQTEHLIQRETAKEQLMLMVLLK